MLDRTRGKKKKKSHKQSSLFSIHLSYLSNSWGRVDELKPFFYRSSCHKKAESEERWREQADAGVNNQRNEEINPIQTKLRQLVHLALTGLHVYISKGLSSILDYMYQWTIMPPTNMPLEFCDLTGWTWTQKTPRKLIKMKNKNQIKLKKPSHIGQAVSSKVPSTKRFCLSYSFSSWIKRLNIST